VLEVRNLHARVEDKEILKGVTLSVEPGQLVVLLGPNGSGKSSLVRTVAGDPHYEVTAVTIATLLLRASGRERDPKAFAELVQLTRRVGLDPSYLSRPVNLGFSGGERKRSELLQVMFLGRKYVLLDEIDSGVDVNGLRLFASIINELRDSGKGILLISHNPHILDYLHVDRVYVMQNGRILRSGGSEILEDIVSEGFQ